MISQNVLLGIIIITIVMSMVIQELRGYPRVYLNKTFFNVVSILIVITYIIIVVLSSIVVMRLMS